jgi:ribosomal protein L36
MTLKIMPDEMSVKSICSNCKHYDRKGGVCTAKSPFAKKGDAHYLLLVDKSSCYGFETA